MIGNPNNPRRLAFAEAQREAKIKDAYVSAEIQRSLFITDLLDRPASTC